MSAWVGTRGFNPWVEIEKWLHTATGQEFCDEMVYGSAGIHTLNAILQEHGLNPTQGNRNHLSGMVDRLLRQGDV